MSGKYEYRGISTFIATLLLMVLAVAAGAIIYAYTMGYLGGLGSSTTPGTLSLDSAKATYSTISDDETKYNVTITAYVRNIGKGNVTLDKAYVDDEEWNFTSVTIAEGDVVKVEIIPPKLLSSNPSGRTYEVKLVATDGTNLVFTVKVS